MNSLCYAMCAFAFASVFTACLPNETVTGGSAGSSSAGVGGGTSGGSSSTGADCAADQKLCGGTCVALDVPMVEVDHKMWRDCDRERSNGCEVDTFSDLNNCGGCGVVCELTGAVASCSEPGYCHFESCKPGWTDCDGLQWSGCEAHFADDVNNCGGCGVVCPSAPHTSAGCDLGKCFIDQCEDGYVDCDHDPSNGCEGVVGCD